MKKKITEKQIENYVLESNAIEGIYDTNGPRFENHILAAKLVVGSDCVVHPKDIHTVLMGGLLDNKYVGEYRKTPVSIGDDFGAPPIAVYYHMQELWQNIGFIVRNKYDYSDKELEKIFWDTHHEFEAIHPFVDGNGRTGRLLLNSLRQTCGLDWIVIEEIQKDLYFATIQAWKNNNFNRRKK